MNTVCIAIAVSRACSHPLLVMPPPARVTTVLPSIRSLLVY